MDTGKDILTQLRELPRGWNFWSCCGIGSGGVGVSLCCEACGWQAEVFAWRPEKCPRCACPLETQGT